MVLRAPGRAAASSSCRKLGTIMSSRAPSTRTGMVKAAMLAEPSKESSASMRSATTRRASSLIGAAATAASNMLQLASIQAGG